MHTVIAELKTGSFWFTFIAMVIVVGLFGFGAYQYTTLTKQTTERITFLESLIASTTQANTRLNGELANAEATVANFSEQVEEITDTVGTLEKLSKTDKELLEKYSKVYFLNEHYIPKTLTTIDTKYTFDPKRTLEIHGEVNPYLEDLLEDSLEDNVSLKITSAYRSFATQTSLKNGYRVTYGTGSNTFSADQGYSEHQLGTTVDFTTSKIGGGLIGFDKTPEYAWLKENAHRYGFILSYPPNNKYYVFEPWHWRFVGKDLARMLHRKEKNFYDLDQREINEYLVSIFD